MISCCSSSALHFLNHAVWAVIYLFRSLFFCHVVLLGEESSQHYTNRQTPTLGYPFHTSRTTQIHPHPQRERE